LAREREREREGRGLRVHFDASGLTTHAGTAKRQPLALTAFAGYTALSVVGRGATAILHFEYAFAVFRLVTVVGVADGADTCRRATLTCRVIPR